MQAVWRDVPAWEGIYQVSNLGGVRSLDRRLPVVNRFGDIENRLHKGRVLRPTVGKNGYATVSFTRPGGVREYHNVHRLVALAFIGAVPEGCEVCHNNGDRADNRVDNLRYDTRSGNALDRHVHGTMNLAYGEKHYFSKLTEQDVRWIRANANSRSQREMADALGVSHSTVGNALHRRQWKHVT